MLGMHVQLQYEDSPPGSSGAFLVTCRLTSIDGRILYAEGIGNVGYSALMESIVC